MLDIVNLKSLSERLTVLERKSILNRALNATPFFNLISIDTVVSLLAGKQYGAKKYIEIDFWLTQIQNNGNQARSDTSSRFNASVYLAETGVPVYGYNQSQLLPVPFIANDINHANVGNDYDTACDIQSELTMPFFIHKGDEVIVNIVNDAPKGDTGKFDTVLSGFNGISYPAFTPTELEMINSSLDDDTIFQTFRIEVDHRGTKIYNFVNDARPRLILGLGGVTTDVPELSGNISEISILDSTRHIKLTSDLMNVDFIAPRILDAFIIDKHISWLPIEHYFMPFGNIRCTIKNNNDVDVAPAPYQLIMLTRTV